MNLRKIKNDDVRVVKSFSDRSGRVRCYTSLKKASFVNKVFWFRPEELALPATMDRVKNDLGNMLENKAASVAHFIA